MGQEGVGAADHRRQLQTTGGGAPAAAEGGTHSGPAARAAGAAAGGRAVGRRGGFAVELRKRDRGELRDRKRKRSDRDRRGLAVVAGADRADDRAVGKRQGCEAEQREQPALAPRAEAAQAEDAVAASQGRSGRRRTHLGRSRHGPRIDRRPLSIPRSASLSLSDVLAPQSSPVSPEPFRLQPPRAEEGYPPFQRRRPLSRRLLAMSVPRGMLAAL